MENIWVLNFENSQFWRLWRIIEGELIENDIFYNFVVYAENRVLSFPISHLYNIDVYGVKLSRG